MFVSSADPVRLGLTASLARPSYNATGVTLLLDETASKRLELIREILPRVQRTAFLWNPDHPDNELVEAQRAAPALNMELQLVELRGPKDLESALRTLNEVRPDALYVVSSRHTVLNIPRIAEIAKANRIPLAGGWGAWARAGGLLSFGPNTTEMARRAGAGSRKRFSKRNWGAQCHCRACQHTPCATPAISGALPLRSQPAPVMVAYNGDGFRTGIHA